MKLEEIYIRDPYILVHNGCYYMYGKVSPNVKEFCVYKSNDLNEWSPPKRVFAPPEDFWATKEFWAPEVHEYSGKFYMFASFKSDDKCRGTQILVSDCPDGEFVPLADTPITPADWECLDGTLYIDKNGKPHIVFCHEWLQIGDGTVCEMELSSDLKVAVSKPRILWKASDQSAVVNYIPNKTSKITDGPFMYRMKNGELICIWSSFGVDGYMELVSRSDNGDIDGNWIVDEKPLSAQHGGHGMIFKDFSGKHRFVMHCPNDDPNERAIIYELQENDSILDIK